MSVIAKIFLSTFMGAMICALLGFFMYFLMTVFDGTKVEEAFGYSLIVGFVCLLIGGFIGLIIGIANLAEIGGALVGVLVTVGIVAFYVLAVGRPGQRSYFFSESRIIFLVLSLPTILTGLLTAMLKNLFSRP